MLFAALLMVVGIYYFVPEQPLPQGSVVDSILVHTSSRRMDVFADNKVLKSYRVSLGRGAWGLHDQDFDNITPPGKYTISGKTTRSQFHKAMLISFGHEIEIHGLKNGLGFIGKLQRWVDWTRGCIALTNAEVDELYAATPIGTPITITR